MIVVDTNVLAVARELGLSLVTADRRLAKAFPEHAVLLADFAARRR